MQRFAERSVCPLPHSKYLPRVIDANIEPFVVDLRLFDALIDLLFVVDRDLPSYPLMPPSLLLTPSHFYFAFPSYSPTAAPGPYWSARLMLSSAFHPHHQLLCKASCVSLSTFLVSASSAYNNVHLPGFLDPHRFLPG
jgi:hypothetical protein